MPLAKTRAIFLFVGLAVGASACGLLVGDDHTGLGEANPLSSSDAEEIMAQNPLRLEAYQRRAEAGAPDVTVSASPRDQVQPNAKNQGLPLPGAESPPMPTEEIDDGGVSLDCVVAGTVTTVGSQAVEPLIRRVAELYLEHCPGLRFVVDPTGDDLGYELLCAGLANLSGTSRPPTEAERQACQSAGIELAVVPLAYQAVVFIANEQNPVACLDRDQIHDLTAVGPKIVSDWSQLPDWPQPTQQLPLEVAMPPSGSVLQQRYIDLVLNPIDHRRSATAAPSDSGDDGGDDGGGNPRLRGDITELETPAAIASAVANNPGGLGWVPYSSVAVLPTGTKVLAVTPGDAATGSGCVVPSPESISSGLYPMAGTLELMVAERGGRNGSVDAFVRGALTPSLYTRAVLDGIGPVGVQPLDPAQLEEVLADWQFR